MRNVGAAWLGSSDSASQTVFKPLTNHGRAQLGLENPPLSSSACVLVDFMHLLAVSQRLQNLSIVAGTGNYRFPYGHAHNVAAPFTQSKRRGRREREVVGGGWRGRSRILKYLEMNIHIQKVRETKEQRMRGVAKEVGKK